jgi:hypothetical protein
MTDQSSESPSGWYAVRSVIRLNPTDAETERPYEERITLWQARTFEEAIQRAEAEAVEYAQDSGDYLIEFGQAYALDEEPGDGVEVFSLLRDSELDPSQYLATFFETGWERSH